MTIAQILVAAGKGARFGGNLPKQYEKLAGRPVIAYTLDAVYNSGQFDTVIVVVAEGDKFIGEIAKNYKPEPIIVTGSTSRTQSVLNGLAALAISAPDLVLIHDAARPFVSARIIADVIDALKDHDAAAPVLPIVDAVKSFDNNALGEDVDRSTLRKIQTPQGFNFGKIWEAFQNLEEGADYSDDIAVALQGGLSLASVPGDDVNFKITLPGDLKKAERHLKDRTYTATGHGYDVHRIEPGESVWLCGVEIAAGFSLKGHSDADVGLHALTDALLGALADGDIGDHFPPSDPNWKNASSDRFLDFAGSRVRERGGRINHVDITLICERPKITPHRSAMRARIAEILNLEENRVSVKATTTEKLGFTGRGEGISAQATASVELPDD